MLQSNKKDFTGQKIAIGIDVHLRTWSVTVLTASGLIRTHSHRRETYSFDMPPSNYPEIIQSSYQPGFCSQRPPVNVIIRSCKGNK